MGPESVGVTRSGHSRLPPDDSGSTEGQGECELAADTGAGKTGCYGAGSQIRPEKRERKSAVELGDERTATPEMCCPDPEKQMQRLPEVRTKTHVYYERFSGW